MSWELSVVSVVHVVHLRPEYFFTEFVKITLGFLLIILDSIPIGIINIPINLRKYTLRIQNFLVVFVSALFHDSVHADVDVGAEQGGGHGVGSATTSGFLGRVGVLGRGDAHGAGGAEEGSCC